MFRFYCCFLFSLLPLIASILVFGERYLFMLHADIVTMLEDIFAYLLGNGSMWMQRGAGGKRVRL